MAPAPIAAPSAALYTDATLRTDLAQVLQRRLPIYSNRNLGNPDNVAKWSDAKRASLWRGIQTAQARFFPTMSLADLAHLILAEGAQESTGDWSQGGGGFLQVTQETVVADYRHHGQPVPGPDGRAIIDPAGPIDLTDPGQNVALWAWYTRNAVAAGISANEVQMPEHRRGGVTRDFGNAQWAWLGGPGNDRHGSSNAGLKDYHDRVKDYFVQAGFGTPEQFEALLDAPVLPTLAYMTDRLAGHAATP